MAVKEVAVKKYVVRLSAYERAQLNDLIRKGKRSAQLFTKARILLKADVSEAGERWSDSRIAEALDTSIANILRTRRQLVEEAFEAVLTRKYNQNSARPRIFDGAAEAKLVALACGPAPEGHAKWTLRLLEDKVVELHIVERASDNTIALGRSKKHSQAASEATMRYCARCQRGLCRQHGRRAGGLSETTRSRAPRRVPRRNLEADDRRNARTILAKPARKARHDYEYERGGVANLFMMFAPLEGWRHVKVTDRHAAIDYAHTLKDLSDMHFPCAAKIVLVQDNLSTHKPASLYEAFPPSEARRLVERFEWHYTPKHGSSLDMAESNSAFSQPSVWIAAFPTNKP